VQIGIGAVTALACVVPLTRFLRAAPRRSASDLRFVAAGVPLALLPAVASLPESRLMLPALLGWAVLLARSALNRLAVWQQTRRTSAAISCAIAASLCLIEIVLPIGYGRAEITGLPALARAVRGAILEPNLDALLVPGQHALLLSASDPTTTIYLPLVRKWHERPSPDSCQLLMGGYGPLKLTRTSPSAFELERLETQLTALDVYASAFNRLPLHAGQRFESGGMDVRIDRSFEGRAIRVHYELHRTLDAPSLVLFAQTEHGLHPLRFPMLGQSTVIGPAAVSFKH
jgi:hypothetical protein